MVTILWLVLVPTVAVFLLLDAVKTDRRYADQSHDSWVRYLDDLRDRSASDSQSVALQLDLIRGEKKVTDSADVLARVERPFYFLTYITPLSVLGFFAFLILPPVLVYAAALVLAWIIQGFKPPHSP
ncbi:MAG: hypothetical protein WBO04_03020 [Steroidobacteraceae bacterium]